MARKKTRRRRAAPAAIVVRQSAPLVRRRAPRGRVVAVGRVRRRRSSSGGGRAKLFGPQMISDLASVAGGAAYGALVTRGTVPGRVAGVESATAIGVALTLVPMLVRGKVGRLVGDVGAGVAAVGAYRVATGLKVWQSAGEWDEEDD